MKRAAFLALCAFVPLLAGSAAATNLDVTSEYRIRALDYKNITYGPPGNDHSFLSQSARLGMAFNDIALGEVGGVPESMDIVLRMRALGVSGSTAPLAAPFDRAAAQYPSTDFTPFFEHAYVDITNLAGFNWKLTVGRQPYQMGSGLLLDDNGAGLMGFRAKTSLPWWGMKTEAFVFQANTRNTTFGPNNLTLIGATLELPTEGTWQLHQLIERDKTEQFAAVNGCPVINPARTGCLVGRATKWFSSIRYQLNWGPMVFDGEAAMQKGAANPTGVNPIFNHITYNGNAQIVRAKWRQTFYTRKSTGQNIRGIARLSVARGSGDNPATPTTDEAFFPSHGMRYDGLERVGFGELYAATPYDAFGGASTATASGLPRGHSGIISVGMGITPPAWHGIVLDVDYFVYQAERSAFGFARTLGTEVDLRFRYDFKDRLQIHLTSAWFEAGAALASTKPSSRRYMLEVSSRF